MPFSFHKRIMNKSNIIRNVNAIHAYHCFHGEFVNIDIKFVAVALKCGKPNIHI